MTNDMLILFQELLEYTIIFTAQVLCIILLRNPVCRWFGAANAYCLWLLPLVWLPFYVLDISAASLGRLLEILPGGGLTPRVEGSLVSTGLELLNIKLSLPAMPDFSLVQSSRPDIWLLVCSLWLVGMVVLLAREGLNMARFARYISGQGEPVREAGNLFAKSSFSKTVPVRYLKGMESPALYGLFNPTLLLPENFSQLYDEDQRHVILSHESVHLQRRDNFWNLLAYLVSVVFWFNPVVHIAHRLYHLDQELSCDAKALKQCNPRQSRRYAGTLVESIEQAKAPRHPPIIAAWENPRELKERILMINQHLKLKSHRITALLCLLMLTVLGGALTACMSGSAVPQVVAAEETSERPVPARRDDMVSRRIYDRINNVIELRDSGNYDESMAILDEIKALDDQGRLNSREQFVLWKFMANLDQIQEKYPEAADAYSRVLGLPNLDQEQRTQALYMRGSLNFVMEDFNAAISDFEEYNRVAREPNADIYYRLGAAHYQLEQYAEAIPLMLRNIELLEDGGKDVPRSSYALLRALYISTDDSRAANDVLEKMIDLYNDPEDVALLGAVQRNERVAAAGGRNGGLGEIVIDNNDFELKTSEMEMLPIMTVQPTYPREAIDQRIEGWALVGFTVMENGSVNNARIIDAEPEEVFDEVSLAAASKFMFNPRMEDGRAVAVEGVRYLFRYSLSSD